MSLFRNVFLFIYDKFQKNSTHFFFFFFEVAKMMVFFFNYVDVSNSYFSFNVSLIAPLLLIKFFLNLQLEFNISYIMQLT